MRAILATLEAPMRSWGGISLGDDRNSLTHPTASGMLGFLGACAGVDRHDKALLDRWYGGWDVITISERAPAMMVDYHSASDSRQIDGKRNVNAVISQRTYLLSTVECVAFIERTESELFAAALSGLATPAYTPFVGRRSNPLMAPPDAQALVCDSASEVVESLRQRWNLASGGKPFLMIAPAGVLERSATDRVLMKAIPDERHGSTYAHSSVMREFHVGLEKNKLEEGA